MASESNGSSLHIHTLDNGTVRFYSNEDVLDYFGNHQYEAVNGKQYKVGGDGVYLNETRCSNVPRVISYDSVKALIRVMPVDSPNQPVDLLIDVLRDRIWDNAGDIYNAD